MHSFSEFETQLQALLDHLYDPLYQPGALLCQGIAFAHDNTGDQVKQAVLAALKQLKPAPEIPATARIWRMYDLLTCRYVQELTQKETALRLGITARHLRREQQQAIQWLAQSLWLKPDEVALAFAGDEHAPPAPADAEDEALSPTWHDQLQQELTVLQQHAPGMIADVQRAVDGLVELGPVLLANPALTLTVGAAPPGLAVMLHPSVLRQVLITAVEKLAQAMTAGCIAVTVAASGERVRICVSGQPVPATVTPESEFIQTILAAQGGVVTMQRQVDCVVVELLLPASTKVTVLIVDDNTDLVHFYRRYTEGTRYQLVHVGEGEQVLPMVAQVQPQLIVLDVMLPDVDGWQLLKNLHQHPATSHVPIIVCSVVRRVALALALGAAEVLVKPVHRHEFIQALEQTFKAVG